MTQTAGDYGIIKKKGDDIHERNQLEPEKGRSII